MPVTEPGPKILIVVVRYRTPLEESETMRTLAPCLAQRDGLAQRFSVLVWDNTPVGQSVADLPIRVEYRHSKANSGVAGAYNYAMEFAEELGASWLLLLDQDTLLPPNFLSAMDGYAARLASDDRIAAVAPTVLMGKTQVSPKILSRWGVSTDPAPGPEGPEFRELIIMNSGMLLRVAALRRIGGYSMDFWLDFSDRYVCHMLAKHRYGAWLAKDLRLDHNVSLMAGEGATSAARYENLMGAQDAYFTQYKSALRNAVFCQRLLHNAWRERHVHPERSRLLYSLLMRRLTVPKRRRLEEWRNAVRAQRGVAAESSPS